MDITPLCDPPGDFALSVGSPPSMRVLGTLSSPAEVWLGFMQKSIIVHECSKIWLMKPAKKYHKSGFTVSFMHFPSQLLLLLSQSRLACEAAL